MWLGTEVEVREREQHSSIKVMPSASLQVTVMRRQCPGAAGEEGLSFQTVGSLEGRWLRPLGTQWGRLAWGLPGVGDLSMQSGDILISHFHEVKSSNPRPEPRRVPFTVNYVFSSQLAVGLGRNTPWHTP